MYNIYPKVKQQFNKEGLFTFNEVNLFCESNKNVFIDLYQVVKVNIVDEINANVKYQLKNELEEQKGKFNKEKEGFVGQIDKLKQAKEKDLTCHLSIDLTEELERTWVNIWKAKYDILNKIKQSLSRCKDDTAKLCEMTRTQLINSKNTLSVSSPHVAEKLVDCVKEVLKKRFTEELNGKIDEKYLARDLFDDALNGKIKEFVAAITKSAPEISEYCEKLPGKFGRGYDWLKSNIPLCGKTYNWEYFQNFIDGYSDDVKSHIEDAQKDERGQKMFDFYKHIFDGSGIVNDLDKQRCERIEKGESCEYIIQATDYLKRLSEKLKECVDNEKC
ncbi:MAG: hypothetical protein J6R86_03355 [Lentisphaeria bacterium]|nr:hypothetical protein [Lentisphaeria bacterium]